MTQCRALKEQSHAFLIVITTEKLITRLKAWFLRSDVEQPHVLYFLGVIGHFVPCFEIIQVLTIFHINEIIIFQVICRWHAAFTIFGVI